MVAGVVTQRTTALAATLGLAVGMVINLTLPWYLYLFTPPDELCGPNSVITNKGALWTGCHFGPLNSGTHI